MRALVASLTSAAGQAEDAAKRDASLRQAADLAKQAVEAAGGSLKRAEEAAAAAKTKLDEAAALVDRKRAAIEDAELATKQTDLEAAVVPLRELARWQAAEVLTRLWAARAELRAAEAELAGRVEAFETVKAELETLRAVPAAIEAQERAVAEARASLDGADEETRAALETALADAERRLAELTVRMESAAGVEETALKREFGAHKAEQRAAEIRERVEALKREYGGRQ